MQYLKNIILFILIGISINNTILKEDYMGKKLTKLQHEVTQNCGTEPPFNNEYWDNKEEGIYVDIINGTPLFCSIHKYDSGSGWPSFYEVLDKNSFTFNEDYKLGYMRKEIKSNKSDSHLGHVFNDGPKNKTGIRYCINSASLRFVSKNDLKKEGYEEYLKLFK